MVDPLSTSHECGASFFLSPSTLSCHVRIMLGLRGNKFMGSRSGVDHYSSGGGGGGVRIEKKFVRSISKKRASLKNDQRFAEKQLNQQGWEKWTVLSGQLVWQRAASHSDKNKVERTRRIPTHGVAAYTSGQLFGWIPISVRCQTSHARTHWQ